MSWSRAAPPGIGRAIAVCFAEYGANVAIPRSGGCAPG